VKGFLSFNPLAHSHVPPDVTAQSCARARYLEILFGVVFTQLMVYFDEEISTFGYVVGVILPSKFKLISENF
jgi:hypothetical protein